MASKQCAGLAIWNDLTNCPSGTTINDMQKSVLLPIERVDLDLLIESIAISRTGRCPVAWSRPRPAGLADVNNRFYIP